jgi:hypothetical protein
MKRFISAILFLSLVVSLSAQIQRGLKETYNVKEFPTVSFVWNTANPDVMDSTQFALYENALPVDFHVAAVPVKDTVSVNKSILILWEDMASHGGQSEFTRSLLTRFLAECVLSKGDRFNVAVFNRKHDNDNSVLHLLSDSFISDGHKLAEAVKGYHRSGEYFGSYPQQSDLYLAINDAVALLQKEPAEMTGVIIVVSAGLNVKASGASTEMETVRHNALRSNIPIYYINYPIAGNAPEMAMLSRSTYGIAVSTTDVGKAYDALSEQYRDMDRRLRGIDYQFVFTAKGERDGKPHTMRLTVDKMRQPLPPYLAPNMTFGMWMKKNWWIALLGLLLMAGIVVLGFMFVRKKKRERDQANQDMQEQMRREHEESERRNRETVEAMRREQAAKEQAAQAAAERAKAAEEEERLLKLMQTKNLYPRLQCVAGSESFSYTISKILTTIGRNPDNDVAFAMNNDSFNNQTVSGRHADIVFNGTAFEVVNRSQTYAQGIVVNGQFYQQYTLRNGDMIGLGEAVIKFYV